MNLFHGSKTAGIKILEPRPHGAVDGESVVFATPDIRFALAMIHGTGKQIAFDYEINQETGEVKVYLDELEKGALALLEQSGYVYQVDAAGFVPDSRLIPEELITHDPVGVLAVEYVSNVLERLKQEGVQIIPYDHVPESMKARAQGADYRPYGEQRFKNNTELE